MNPRFVRHCAFLATAIFSAELVVLSQPSFAEEATTPAPIVNQLKSEESIKAKKTKTSLNIRSGIINWKEGADNGLVTAIRATGAIEHQLLNSVQANASVSAVTASGRVQEINGNGEGADFNIKEASLMWLPLDSVSLKVGAINQSVLNAPLLVNNRAFIGTSQGFETNPLGVNVKLLAQQLVPTSETLNSDRNVEEPLPYFFTQSVLLETPSDKVVHAGIGLSLFNYSDLPSVVAADSSLLGNTVIGGSGPSSKFAEEFSGYHLSVNGELKLITQASLKLWSTWLENTASESQSRQGQLVGGSLNLNFPSFRIEPKMEVFFKEADAVPASYSSELYAFNNRRGYRAGVVFELPETGFLASVFYVNADTIFTSAAQDRYENYEIRIEFNDIQF